MKAADWIALASGIGGGALAAYSSSKNRSQDRELREDENEMSEAQALQRTALQESIANPFRHQRDQAASLTSLDMLQRFGQGGRHITPPSNVAPFAGNVRPGYQPSDRMRADAGRLYDDVAAGHTAPTMTDPANYGKTGAVNLSAPAAGTGPVVPASTDATMVDPMSYLEGYGRRNEGAGGAWSGMLKGGAMGGTIGAYVGGVGAIPGALIGGAAGLIGGAFTKNAKTAEDDLTVDQAKEIITQVFQREGGRAPTPQELDAIIAGQGYKAGDWGVGESGLLGSIRNLQGNFQTERRGRAA